jgi:hypothetical protein
VLVLVLGVGVGASGWEVWVDRGRTGRVMRVGEERVGCGGGGPGGAVSA